MDREGEVGFKVFAQVVYVDQGPDDEPQSCHEKHDVYALCPRTRVLSTSVSLTCSRHLIS